jgi:hypothetical protein
LYRSSIVIPSSTWRGTRSRVSWSRAAPYVQRPIVQQLISWSDWMLYMRPSGSPASVETIFRLGFAAVFPKDSAAPVPIETINGFRFPSSTDRLLGSRSVKQECWIVVRSDTSVYEHKRLGGITAIPQQHFRWEKHLTAVLARTSRQSGLLKLQSGRLGLLYFASVLLLMGHGDSVVAFSVKALDSLLGWEADSSIAEIGRAAASPRQSRLTLREPRKHSAERSTRRKEKPKVLRMRRRFGTR